MTDLILFAVVVAMCIVSYLAGHLRGWKDAFKNFQGYVDERTFWA